MKRFLFCLLFFVCSLTLKGQVQPESFALTPAVTTLAGASTNSAAGTAVMLYDGKANVRIYLTANGIASTTNGSLIVKFSTASGTGYNTTNNYDTASLSNIKLTMSTLAGATNTISDQFDLSGVKYIRVGQIENTFTGPVSNIVIRVGYQNIQ
jgi:hypothetical protein